MCVTAHGGVFGVYMIRIAFARNHVGYMLWVALRSDMDNIYANGYIERYTFRYNQSICPDIRVEHCFIFGNKQSVKIFF